jgi:hypothetical protein
MRSERMGSTFVYMLWWTSPSPSKVCRDRWGLKSWRKVWSWYLASPERLSPHVSPSPAWASPPLGPQRPWGGYESDSWMSPHAGHTLSVPMYKPPAFLRPQLPALWNGNLVINFKWSLSGPLLFLFHFYKFYLYSSWLQTSQVVTKIPTLPKQLGKPNLYWESLLANLCVGGNF